MKRIAVLAAAACAMAVLSAAPTFADGSTSVPATGKWLINLRATDVIPDANNPIFAAGGAYTGLNAQVGDSVMPTLGIDYFVTPQISAEVVLGFTHHTVDAVAAADGSRTKVHSTWVLPPILTLKYHPFPDAKISPYVGVGANLMVFFSGQDYNGFTTHLSDRFGYDFQAGMDIPVQGPWSLNLDAKKSFIHSRATINGGALYSNVTVSPWVISAGFGRRF